MTDATEENTRVKIASRHEQTPVDARHKLQWRNASCETFQLPYRGEVEYKWTGEADYLCLHDTVLSAGGIDVDGSKPSCLYDLRGKLSFVPKGCAVSGWAQLAPRKNSFIALYSAHGLAAEELECSVPTANLKPEIHFDDPNLRGTLLKLWALVSSNNPADAIYAETLSLLARIEVARHQAGGQTFRLSRCGGLSINQQRVVLEFIFEHLHRAISLTELADLANLSRFHFLRAFRKTFGMPPHQFITQTRIERARFALISGDIPIEQIARSVGYKSSSQFSATFSKIVGCTPTQFRRSGR
jgi:AraC family transcriptional regulator